MKKLWKEFPNVLLNRWSRKSVQNLESISNYIAENSPFFASITIQNISNLINKLKEYPLLGRIVPEYNDKYLRELIYKNYRIVNRL